MQTQRRLIDTTPRTPCIVGAGEYTEEGVGTRLTAEVRARFEEEAVVRLNLYPNKSLDLPASDCDDSISGNSTIVRLMLLGRLNFLIQDISAPE